MAAPQTDVLSIEEIAVDDSEDLGSIAFVTINRADKLNALNAEVMSSLKNMVDWVEQTDNIRVVVITGAQPNEPEQGKRAKPNAFVAGADITEFVGKKSDDIRKMFTDNAVEALWNISKPTIAMVDGFALGGGCEVAMACHFRYASENAKFGQPEVSIGLIAGFGGTQRLRRLVGKGIATELLLTGKLIDSKEALRIGLVNGVVEESILMETCIKIAKKIQSNSPLALEYTLAAINNGEDKSLDSALNIEAEYFEKVFETMDRKEGLSAFIEKRKPNYKGQ